MKTHRFGFVVVAVGFLWLGCSGSDNGLDFGGVDLVDGVGTDTPALELAPDAPALEVAPDAPALEVAPDAPALEVAPDAPALEVAPDAPALEVAPDAPALEVAPDAEPELADDVPVVGKCEAGQSAGFVKVRLEDSPDNATLLAGDCGAGNPGADIDAVCVFDPSDAEKGCAATVEVEPWGEAVCKNDKDDPQQILGAPDGVAGGGTFVGYYSLNGGAVIVGFDAGIEMLCGDTVHVWEMFNPDVAGSVEDYKITLGTGDGMWNIESDYATGENDLEVTWEW